MTTQDITPVSKPKSRAWLWCLLAMPASGVLLVGTVIAMHVIHATKGIDKNPGYQLAAHTLTTHPGVVSQLGAPVSVTRTKSWNYTTTPTETTIELTVELQGSSATGKAGVFAREKAGRWSIERATISGPSGGFGLLADGGLQPLYEPKTALAVGP
jgi:hypothetical protein